MDIAVTLPYMDIDVTLQGIDMDFDVLCIHINVIEAPRATCRQRVTAPLLDAAEEERFGFGVWCSMCWVSGAGVSRETLERCCSAP